MQGKCTNTKCRRMLFDVPDPGTLSAYLTCLKCGRRHTVKVVDGVAFYKAISAKVWQQAE